MGTIDRDAPGWRNPCHPMSLTRNNRPLAKGDGSPQKNKVGAIDHERGHLKG